MRVPMTLGRYFGMRFLVTALAVFGGVVFLVALLDSVELMRRTAGNDNATALAVIKLSFFRVPIITERIMPFCALIGAMSCYLNLSRRNELVVARAAGVSAWEFTAPAVIVALLLGLFATLVYNPVAASLQERAKRYEVEIFGAARIRSAGIRFLGAPAQHRRSVDHQRPQEPRTGPAPRRRHRFHLRSAGPLSGPHRGSHRGAEGGRLGTRRGARLSEQ